jgi:putative flippase GtrA
MIKQLFRFGVVGLTAATVHFYIVVSIVETWDIVPLIANVFAFGISFQISYWGHRMWTFVGTTTLHREAFPKLVFIQALNFAANESLFYVFLAMDLPYPVALAIVLTILPIFTFVSSKLWVFR